jgi:RNA polymerase sigma-70 factor, ECF subfamily
LFALGDYLGVLAAILSRTGVLSFARGRESDVPRFEALVKAHSAALQRLTFGYEASAEARRDLHQEILVALWRSLPSFEGRSSLKTWVLRIAHNVAASHVLHARRHRTSAWRSLEELGDFASSADEESARLSRIRVEELAHGVRELRPLDRQLVLLFLEGFSSSEIAEVMGISDTNASTRLSRLRAVLRGRLEEGHRDE